MQDQLRLYEGVKYCQHCGAVLIRRSNEYGQNWRRRQFCSNACRGVARSRSWVAVDGPPWTVTDCGYSTPCWVWDRVLDKNGYGQIKAEGVTEPAHRWVYERFIGRMPRSRTYIDHLCRVHACVNPAHLEPVTNAENAQRGNQAVLTASQVAEIRQRRRDGERAKDIAVAFGIAAPTVSNRQRPQME